GTGACFAVNAVSFLAVIVAIWRIELPAAAPAKESLGESLRAGLRHVFGDPLLRTLIVLGLVGSLLGYPLITYLPVIAGDVLGTGAGGVSALLTSYGAGAILGAGSTAHPGHLPRRGRLTPPAGGACGAPPPPPPAPPPPPPWPRGSSLSRWRSCSWPAGAWSRPSRRSTRSSRRRRRPRSRAAC